jgi:hypothetical protein
MLSVGGVAASSRFLVASPFYPRVKEFKRVLVRLLSDLHAFCEHGKKTAFVRVKPILDSRSWKWVSPRAVDKQRATRCTVYYDDGATSRCYRFSLVVLARLIHCKLSVHLGLSIELIDRNFQERMRCRWSSVKVVHP